MTFFFGEFSFVGSLAAHVWRCMLFQNSSFPNFLGFICWCKLIMVQIVSYYALPLLFCLTDQHFHPSEITALVYHQLS